MHEQLKESRESLWWLVAAPLLWAAHLLASYITAAIYCEKAPARHAASLAGVRVAIGIYSLIALAAIGGIAIRGYRRHRHGGHAGHAGHAVDTGHASDTPEDRHRFLGFATCLLAGLSGIAVLYQALPALFLGSCR